MKKLFYISIYGIICNKLNFNSKAFVLKQDFEVFAKIYVHTFMSGYPVVVV